MVKNKESPPFDKLTRLKYCRAYMRKKYQLQGRDLSQLTEREVEIFLERVDHLTTVSISGNISERCDDLSTVYINMI